MVTVEKKSLLHRSRVDIIANILHVAETGAKKTHIMYQCNLSYRQLNIYLDFLIEKDLLRHSRTKTPENDDTNTYQTTEKGRAFMQAYRSIRVILTS